MAHRLVKGVVALFFAALLAAPGNAGPPEGTQAAGAAMTITASGLSRVPEPYYGKTVRVSARVDQTLGPNMFTFDESAAFAGPDLLVLVPRGAGSVRGGQKVEVTGEVRRFRADELERDFSFFQRGRLAVLGANVDWNSRPVVVATSVRADTGRELLP